MNYFEIIIKSYERIGIPHRGRCDDIKIMVYNFCNNVPSAYAELVSLYSMHRYIKKIDVRGDSFFIDYDEGSVFFKTMSDEFFSLFCNNIFDNFRLRGECHNATLKFLKEFRSPNFKAVTSLCVRLDNHLFFHSYIYDSNTNLVYDFSRKIIMEKSMYDSLFCYKEINCLDYNEFISYFSSSDYGNCNYCELLYLAYVTLKNNKSSDFSKVKKSRI